jgi:hypothetical protein
MAWTVLVPLLANLLATTPAQAADPYNVTGTKQIQSVGGKCAGGNPSTLTFTDGPSSVNPLAQQYPAGTFEGQQLNLNNEFIDLFIITNVSPNNKANPAQGAYTANITTKGYELHAGGTPTTVTPGCDLEGPIQIDNKNHIKLADANGNLQPGTATNNAATESTQCYSGDTTTWLVCGIIINTLADSINWILQNVIIPLLNVAPLNTKDPTYPIWSAFRNVASIFFILVFFLTIFGTAIGFDNYTIKKILPRLVAGAILVPFSWYICTIVIDIGNVFGRGLLTLAGTVLPPANITLTSLASKGILVFLALSAATVAWTTISAGLLISILIAIIGAFLTLIFRQVLITLLVVMSPFALLAWILPNTEKYFKLWYTNFAKTVLMYPLIILLFVSGQLFADTAGALGGSAQNLPTFFALAGLFAPMFLIPWTFKWAGGAMAAGAGAIGRFGKQYDNRLGKDSQWAKDRAELKSHNMLQRQYEAERNGHGFRARFFRSQTGQPGTGFNSMFGLRGNRLQQQALREKRDAAYDTEGKIGGAEAAAASGQLLSHRDRLESARLQGANDAADKNAQRHGILLADRQRNPTGRTVAEERFDAATTTNKRSLSAEIGKNRGINDAEDLMYQHGSVIGQEARFKEQSNQAMERGKIDRAVQAVNTIDAFTRSQNMGMSARGATQVRMQTIGNAAGIQHQAEIGKLYGQSTRTVTEEAAAPESVLTQVAAADLSERKAIQDAKAARAEALRIQTSVPGGRVTDDQARTASNIEAREHAAQGVAHQQAVITGEATAGHAGGAESVDDLVEGMYRQEAGKVMDEINARREGLRAENADIQDRRPGGMGAPLLTPDQVRAAAIQRRQDASRQVKFVDANASVGQRTAVINAARANRAIDYTQGAPAARMVRQASAYNEGKKLGADYGGYVGSVDAAITEAAEAGLGVNQAFSNAALQGSAGRAGEAARIKSGREKATAYSAEKNLIRGQAVRRVDLGEVAEQAQREGELTAASDNAAILGKLTEAQEADAKAAAAAGLPLGTSARDLLINEAANKSEFEARDTTANSYEETAGSNRGRRQAIDKELQRVGINPATATAVQRDIAEGQIIDRGARIAGQNKKKDVAQAAATNVGTENIRNQAIQDVRDATGAPTNAAAQAILDSRAYESARITGEDKETDTLGDEEGTAGSEESAIDIYLDEQNSDRTEAERAAIRANPAVRADALRAIRRTNRQARTRTTGNARTGKITENRGIIESRSRAVLREKRAGRAVTDDDAYRNLDRNAHATIYKGAADKYNKDIGDEQATAEQMEGALNDEMKAPGKKPKSREEAQYELARQQIEKQRETKSNQVGEEFGQNRKDEDIRKARNEAVEEDMVADELAAMDRARGVADVGSADWRRRNQARIESDARSRLATRSGQLRNRREVLRRERIAGGEGQVRNRNLEMGKTAGLARQAATSPSERLRLDSNIESEDTRLANETATIEAAGRTRPGQPEHITPQKRLEAARIQKEIDQIKQIAAEHANDTFVDADGNRVPVRAIELGPDNRKEIRRTVTSLLKDNKIGEARAYVARANQTGGGQQEVLVWLRSNVFGGSDTQLVDPTLFGGKANEYWDILREGATFSEAMVPPAVGYEKITAKKAADMHYRELGLAIAYDTDKTRGGNQTEEAYNTHMNEMATAIVGGFTTPGTRQSWNDVDRQVRGFGYLLKRDRDNHGFLVDAGNNPLYKALPERDPATGDVRRDTRTGAIVYVRDARGNYVADTAGGELKQPDTGPMVSRAGGGPEYGDGLRRVMDTAKDDAEGQGIVETLMNGWARASNQTPPDPRAAAPDGHPFWWKPPKP